MASQILFFSELIQALFSVEHNVKLYHWQTTSYARHKATCDFLTAYLPLVDQFIEVYLGHNPEVKSKITKMKMFDTSIAPARENLADLSQDSTAILLNDLASRLQKIDQTGFIKQSDLLNIRDEIVSQIKQTLYLFSFH